MLDLDSSGLVPSQVRILPAALNKDPVFEGINPEELEEPIPESKWRRPFMIVISIFLAVLVFSLLFADALSGVVQSKTVTDQALVFLNATIIFENNTLELLQNEFIENEHREIKACLFGRQQDSAYIVSRVEFPKVIRANVVHVMSAGCPINTLIDLHSHPINRCLASMPDVAIYGRNKQSNPGLRMMIMCSTNRFALI